MIADTDAPDSTPDAADALVEFQLGCCRWHAAGGSGSRCLIASPAELRAATASSSDDDGADLENFRL